GKALHQLEGARRIRPQEIDSVRRAVGYEKIGHTVAGYIRDAEQVDARELLGGHIGPCRRALENPERIRAPKKQKPTTADDVHPERRRDGHGESLPLFPFTVATLKKNSEALVVLFAD